jgi:curved DNA-binding protein CbpA
MIDDGYVNYFEVLELGEDCKPGEVRTNYKRLIKDLLQEIGRAQITESRRDAFLLDIAKHNAAFYILRDNELRQRYAEDRAAVVTLEDAWHKAEAENPAELDTCRRKFDAALRHFLSRYMEELVLQAGRDKECVEASHWSRAHERHASRVLRHFRQRVYHQIQERLPYYEVTRPEVDWNERKALVNSMLKQGSAV